MIKSAFQCGELVVSPTSLLSIAFWPSRRKLPGPPMSDRQSDKTVDLSAGVSESSVADNSSLAGKIGDDDVLLVRSGNRFFAVGAHCTHYRGPLADGIIVGSTIRCPLHHSCFNLETGEALRAPALDPISCWRVEQRDGKVFVREKLAQPGSTPSALKQNPSSIVISHWDLA